jgi:hypothetical protein
MSQYRYSPMENSYTTETSCQTSDNKQPSYGSPATTTNTDWNGWSIPARVQPLSAWSEPPKK